MAEIPDDELLHGWKPRLGRLSVPDKIGQAELLKRQGNLFVHQNELKRALRAYAQVFAYVNGLSVAGDAMSQYAQTTTDLTATQVQGEQIEALKVAVWANMALCYVRLGVELNKALKCCQQVLALQPQHSKARFRKAQVLVQLKQYERAFELLSALLKEEPKNAAVRKEIRLLQDLKRAHDAETRAKEKQVYGSIFQ
uniref:peptidylprolyl isomerase n=1 Tax=Peronospora matthiolae TaxID=2874970 RepID=A0AAV1VGQ0_9STRA